MKLKVVKCKHKEGDKLLTNACVLLTEDGQIVEGCSSIKVNIQAHNYIETTVKFFDINMEVSDLTMEEYVANLKCEKPKGF
jgi:hypothetical protein